MVIDEADTFLDAGFRNEIEKYIHIIKNKNINHEIKTKLFFVGATYTGPLNSFFFILIRTFRQTVPILF